MKHPLSSVDISIFSSETNKFCNIIKYRYRLDFGTQFLFIFESFNIFSIHMVTILMMPAELATPYFLKRKIFSDISK